MKRFVLALGLVSILTSAFAEDENVGLNIEMSKWPSALTDAANRFHSPIRYTFDQKNCDLSKLCRWKIDGMDMLANNFGSKTTDQISFAWTFDPDDREGSLSGFKAMCLNMIGALTPGMPQKEASKLVAKMLTLKVKEGAGYFEQRAGQIAFYAGLDIPDVQARYPLLKTYECGASYKRR